MSNATCKTLGKNSIERQYAQANNRILARNNPVLDTTEAENNIALKRKAEERIFHTIAKGYDLLGMWQGSQNLRATQKASRPQPKQMTAVGYLLNTEEIVDASWTNFHNMVQLHLNCQKDHISHQLCLQRTSLEDELKY
jgi:hypothetical protein